MIDKHKIFINQIVKYSTMDGQMQQTQEELNELNLAISKYRRKSNKYSMPLSDSWQDVLKNLKEEMADVLIMIFQMMVYFDCEQEIEEIMLDKCIRTINRLREFDD